ncbi:hypothetical protein I4U23_012554 [Adineta vaga]|nr:hypothetical protein I4U23_012554 [Adineta vaga]
MEIEKNEVVFWYFKSNVNPWPNIQNNESSLSDWTKYGDIETKIIEEAFQQKRTGVALDEYRIDFEHLIQVDLTDESKQRPVKRQLGDSQQMCKREHRFSSNIATISSDIRSVSFGAPDAWCPFLNEWLKTSSGSRAFIDVSICTEECAKGIEREALLHHNNSKAIAAYMAEKIRACKGLPNLPQEVPKICIGFYTCDSFLYAALNTAVRDCDRTKLETLGPFCYFLLKYSRSDKGFYGEVFRGVNLSYADIQMYKRSIGHWQTWLSFTSTSRKRDVAELYSTNTLFIIHIANVKVSGVRGCSISHLSHFSVEEEVLIPAGTTFRIKSVEETLFQKFSIINNFNVQYCICNHEQLIQVPQTLLNSKVKQFTKCSSMCICEQLSYVL